LERLSFVRLLIVAGSEDVINSPRSLHISVAAAAATAATMHN